METPKYNGIKSRGLILVVFGVETMGGKGFREERNDGIKKN